MYACILIPRELSLVLTLHPNPMHVLEMSAIVWSNSHLSPGTVFYPDEGEVRLDKIETRMVIPDEDIRRYYGCYDAIMNVNGQEVRHCNWVRFVKTTSEPDQANVISSKVRGQSFYQVIRPVKPNQEIIVYFHLTSERPFYDRIPCASYASYCAPLAPNLHYADLQSSVLAQHAPDVKSSMVTSTPLTTRLSNRASFHEEPIVQQRKSLKFGSSSSSSSLASPQLDTTESLHCERNFPHESSFTSPMFTSSSSRETSGSEIRSGPVTDASPVKDSNEAKENSHDEYGDKCIADDSNTKNIDGKDMNKNIPTMDCSNGNCHDNIHDSNKLDVVHEEISHVDDEEEDISDDFNDSENSADDEEAASSTRNDNINDVLGEDHKPSRLTDAASPQPSPEEKTQAPDARFTPRKEMVSTILEPADQHSEVTNSSNQSQKSDIKIQQPRHETTATISVDESDKKLTVLTADENKSLTSDDPSRGRCSYLEEVRSSETDFSSPNDSRTLSYKLSQSPESPRKLDQHQEAARGHPQVKRCRERTWWPCEVCGKKFDRPSLLKRHTRTHTGEKPHACDVCGKAFSTSSSLNTHRRIHSGEKPHQCKICGKRFTASSNLYYHRMTHNKEKPHKCELCSKSFPTPGDLRSHMYIHNGSWPFRCDVCNRGFSKHTNLKNHMLLHSGDKPHECPRCGKRFALLCNMKTHQKTHDNSESSDCAECLKCGAAMEISDELQENVCKRCEDASRPISSKSPTAPSLSSTLRRQRHTDFSISKITSSDARNHEALSERSFTSLMSAMTSDVKVETIVSPGYVNLSSVSALKREVPSVYRQYLQSVPDHRWLLPSSLPLPLSQAPFFPVPVKHPSTFPDSAGKNSERQTSTLTKLGTATPTQPTIPAFITPEMISLRGGVPFPPLAAFPHGFSMHTGPQSWGGHVIAQGF